MAMRFNGHFPGKAGLAGPHHFLPLPFPEGTFGDKWHKCFYMLDVFSVTQSAVSKH